MSFRVLAIDGGGIRGIIPASVLACWESEYDRKCVDHFDLIVGTSTGSILAAALACGISAKDLVQFYKSRASTIFRLSVVWRPSKLTMVRRAFRPPYATRVLRDSVDEILDGKLLDDCQTRVCICSINSVTAEPRVFKTNHDVDYVRDYKLRLADVVAASCAAPTYFPGHLVESSTYVDGGLWANNPALVGVVEARRILGDYDLEKIQILSLGCGQPRWSRPLGFSQRAWGLRWLFPVIDLQMRVQSASVNNYCNQVLLPSNYLRIDMDLAKHLGALDSVRNIDELAAQGESTAYRYISEIENRFGESSIAPYTRARQLPTAKGLEQADTAGA